VKRLLLIRHAKSCWQDTELADIDRPLNGRGKRDAPAMAERLRQRYPCPDLILSSPAKRARKTAKLMAEAIGYDKSAIRQDPRIYLQGVDGLLAVLRDVDEQAEQVWLFGHNPDISALAERLAGAGLGEIPTAAVVALALPCQHWRELAGSRATLEHYDYPKLPAH
jgi:phosphohistidine phosphatase